VVWEGSAGDRRKVTTTGIINTIVGTGVAGFSGDRGPAISAQVNFGVDTAYSTGMALDAAGNLYFCDHDNRRIRRVTPDGIITTYAGGGGVPLRLARRHRHLSTLPEELHWTVPALSISPRAIYTAFEK
jgi:hypothetical protein